MILAVYVRNKGDMRVEDIIDIHSHILPGIDDGASSTEAALHMLREARRQGIREVIATPHYSRRFQNNCPERIRELCGTLQKMSRENRMEIRIHSGQEILYSGDVPGMVAQGELLTMADSHYVLIEFYPGISYLEILRAVRTLVLEGFSPVLAHVERYRALRDEERLEELTGQGAYMQMNFSSVSGNWMNETVRWCRKMLREQYIHFMGTDMHDVTLRKPETEAAVRWMRKKLDQRYMRNLLRGNAEKIIRDEKI